MWAVCCWTRRQGEKDEERTDGNKQVKEPSFVYPSESKEMGTD